MLCKYVPEYQHMPLGIGVPSSDAIQLVGGFHRLSPNVQFHGWQTQHGPLGDARNCSPRGSNVSKERSYLSNRDDTFREEKNALKKKRPGSRTKTSVIVLYVTLKLIQFNCNNEESLQKCFITTSP